MKSALRRVSTQPDGGEVSTSQGELRTIKRTFSTAASVESSTARRPSLATLSSSLRLGRSSKKAQSTSTPSSTEPNQLGQLFFSLPNELHALVLSFVEPRDILSLRLSCHMTQSILDLCAHQILTTHLPQAISSAHIPHILRLYPPPLPNISLSHYLRLLRIDNLTTQTTNLLTAFMQMKIYMLPPTRQHQRITSLNTSRSALLASHLYPALWTINHYLTFHRDLLIHAHPSHTNTPSSKRSRLWACPSCGDVLSSLIASYPPETLLSTYQVMRLLQIHLKASSRAPSYAGTIERVVRRWSRRPAGEEELSVVMLLGGLQVLRKVTVLRGTYNSRLEVLRTFLEEVEGAVQESRDRAEAGRRGKVKGAGKMVVGKKGGIVEWVEVPQPAPAGDGTGEGDGEGDPDDTDETLRRRRSSTSGPAEPGSKDKGKGKAPPSTTSATAFPTAATATTTTNGDYPYPYPPPQPLPPQHTPSLPHHLLTPTTLTQVPALLEDILLPELRRRIEAEALLVEMLPHPDDQVEELETPYHWVRRVICGEEMEEERRAERGEGDEEEEVRGDGGSGGWNENGNASGTVSGTGVGMGMGQASQSGGGGVQAGMGQTQQQQQSVAAAGNGNGNGPRTSAGMFGSMSRHMLVSVGRGD